AYTDAAERYEKALDILVREASRVGAPSESVAERIIGVAARMIEAVSMFAPDRAATAGDAALAAMPPRLAPLARADLLRRKSGAMLKLGRIHEAEAALGEAEGLAAARPDTELQADLAAERAALL